MHAEVKHSDEHTNIKTDKRKEGETNKQKDKQTQKDKHLDEHRSVRQRVFQGH